MYSESKTNANNPKRYPKTGLIPAALIFRLVITNCKSKYSFIYVRPVALMVCNGLQLQEVGDFEALNCLPALNLIRSTKLHLTSEPPISCRCCYGSFFFSQSFRQTETKSQITGWCRKTINVPRQ